jgi:hypothetical protein
MAALKKSGEEEWKKRSIISGANEELGDGSSSKPGIVKLHKEQLQQQLNIGMPKSTFNYQSKLNTSEPTAITKRTILAPLNDNNMFDECNLKQLRAKTQSNESIDSLEMLVNNNMDKKNTNSKRTPFKNPSESNKNFSSTSKVSKLTRIHSTGSDTDSMFLRNSNMLNKNLTNNNYYERVELFSTDSEMDSFFKENESIVNRAYKYNNDNMSSSTSPNKTDNTIENIDDDEFDRIVSEAQRYLNFNFSILKK